jgi:saccharopine dehydrogenase-like NADP-dependent oxidoreductase
VVVGTGAVGSRAARQLASTEGMERVFIADVDGERAHAVAASLGDIAAVVRPPAADIASVDVVVLAAPTGHRQAAERALERGASVVSAVDDVDEVRALMMLDAEARERGLSVVIGAAFSPGLTCVLARHASFGFDSVEQVHVAKAGTGGPACARQHHRALATEVVDWRDGAWARRSGGSGREVCFFPDPVGGQDCYRAAVPDALLLAPAFTGVQRVTARMAATRRDRLTSWLPMLRPPHPEGVIGGVRVEVRGRRGPTQDIRVLGAIDRPAIAAGAVAAVAAVWAAEGRLARPGAGGLAELLDEPVPFLRELARRGVKAAVFEGAAGLVA